MQVSHAQPFCQFICVWGHSSQIQQLSGIVVLKSSNFYQLLVFMRDVFPENFSLIAQFNLFLWLFKVLEIVRKCPFYNFFSFSGTLNFT